MPSSVPSVPLSALEGHNSTPGDDEDVDMDGVEDRRPGKGGKVVRLKGTYIEVLDRFRNIAPILDAVMADTDQSGQVRGSQTFRIVNGLISSHCLSPSLSLALAVGTLDH